VPAGWTIQQITHCSASLPNSDSLVNHSSAAALGEADLTSTAAISRRVGKSFTTTTVASAATIATIKAKTATASATVTTGATIGAVRVAAPTVSTGTQDIAALVAAIAGGVGA
jgi:aspartyl aminopeptidase